MKFDGVKTRIKPQQMNIIPVSFISENWISLKKMSQTAEAGTAAIRPKVMKCSYVMRTLRFANMLAADKTIFTSFHISSCEKFQPSDKAAANESCVQGTQSQWMISW